MDTPSTPAIIEHRQYPKSVMVWGEICASGKTHLDLVGVKINQKVYQRDILGAVVLPWVQKHLGNTNWMLQQDSAPARNARKTQERCKGNDHPTRWISIPGIAVKIGSCVGRNQTTVMWICDHWMQDGTTDRRGRSHPPQCTTSREDRQIMRMAVTDRSVTSRTLTQHIESITHHSVSARTIRRRLQQSGLSERRPLLGLPLTQNHRRLRH
ncbi:transposable element Tcb1 transposase [Trichonephila clavipes]|nr:transposable element Tcb1 transposase [Trichonephila clavipes]